MLRAFDFKKVARDSLQTKHTLTSACHLLQIYILEPPNSYTPTDALPGRQCVSDDKMCAVLPHPCVALSRLRSLWTHHIYMAHRLPSVMLRINIFTLIQCFKRLRLGRHGPKNWLICGIVPAKPWLRSIGLARIRFLLSDLTYIGNRIAWSISRWKDNHKR